MWKSRNYPPDETLEERKRKEQAKQETNNPCLQEHRMSLECLDRNFYDKDACRQFFDNYKKCKEFWYHVYQTRKKQNIQPYLPDIEDRESVKRAFLSQRT